MLASYSLEQTLLTNFSACPLLQMKNNYNMHLFIASDSCNIRGLNNICEYLCNILHVWSKDIYLQNIFGVFEWNKLV